MLENVNKTVLAAIFALTCGLILLLLFAPLADTIIVLNGIFTGSMFAILFAYWRIIGAAFVTGSVRYSRVDQIALGFFLCWIGYDLQVAISIYYRILGINAVNIDDFTSMLIVASRYVAIVAAWLQVTAPDFGRGIFYGRERKILWFGVSLGMVISAVLIYAQDGAILS